MNPLGLNGSAADGIGQFAFATSLAKIKQAAETAGAAQDNADAAVMGLGNPLRPRLGQDAPPSKIDVWAQGSITYYEDSDIDARQQGHASVAFLGVDYLVRPALLVGLLVQSDWTRERSAEVGATASGHGWMAGPYISVGLTPNLFFDARAAWGQSANSIDPLGVYTDDFSTDRSLLSARLTGNWAYGALWFRPSAEITYFQETQMGFTNQLAIDIPEQSISLGRVTFGPEVGYAFKLEDGAVLAPYVGLKGVWDFSQTADPALLGIADDDLFRGKAELGATLTTPSGISIRASGSYDGIGNEEFNAYEGWVSIAIPLN